MVTKYLASKGGFLAHKLKGDSLSWWGRQCRVVLWWQKHSVADTCSPLSRPENVGRTGSEPDNLKACPNYLLLPVRLHHLKVLQSPKTAAAEDQVFKYMSLQGTMHIENITHPKSPSYRKEMDSVHCPGRSLTSCVSSQPPPWGTLIGKSCQLLWFGTAMIMSSLEKTAT